MTTDFAPPRPAPIGRISPSLANRLIGCGLRVAYERDPSLADWRRPSTFSLLGEVAHDLAETIERGHDLPQDREARRDALGRIWQAKIESAEARLASAWGPVRTPTFQKWPGYQITRARTIGRGMRHIAPRVPRQEGASKRTRKGGLEVELEDSRRELFGRVDKIEWIDGHAHIIDLKLGVTAGQPTEDHRRQLLLYAVLLNENENVWPQSIAIETGNGTRHVVPYSIDEAESLADEILALRTTFNLRSSDEHITSARPREETCRWCEFRVGCPEYWREVRSEWRHGALKGEVISTGTASNGTFVKLRPSSPTELASAVWNVSELQLPESDFGSEVALVGLANSGENQSLRARWDSRTRSC